MYRGRAGGRGGRPYPSLRGVRPVQMKPGRGRSAGGPPSGYAPGRPRPLLEPGWAPPPPRPPPPHMMRPMGPRPPPPPFAGAPRGRGLVPRGRGGLSRGRGAASAAAAGGAGRGFSSTRGSRGTRGRGATRARGRGATSTTPSRGGGATGKNTKGEKERDEIALSRPWVTDALRAEIQKKSELQAISLKTKSEKDFEAFKEQRTKVGNMLRAAKMEYIGMQDEEDVDKIMADARQKTKEALAAEKKEEKTENGNGAVKEEVKTEPAEPAAAAETTTNGDAAAPEVKTEAPAV